MKLRVMWTETTEHITEVDVKTFAEARRVIDALTNNDFREKDKYNFISVEDEKGEDVTGDIQPNCPNIG